MPILTVLAGPNGAGKTRFSQLLFERKILSVLPFNPDVVDVEFPSMLSQFLTYECESAINENRDFAFECNLRKGQLQQINQFKEKNYTINLVYFYLEDLILSEQRVKYRVEIEKGNFVNAESIQDNFYSGLKNLDNTFDFWDSLLLINNSKQVSLDSGADLEISLIVEKGKFCKVHRDFPPEKLILFLPLLAQEIKKFRGVSL